MVCTMLRHVRWLWNARWARSYEKRCIYRPLERWFWRNGTNLSRFVRNCRATYFRSCQIIFTPSYESIRPGQRQVSKREQQKVRNLNQTLSILTDYPRLVLHTDHPDPFHPLWVGSNQPSRKGSMSTDIPMVYQYGSHVFMIMLFVVSRSIKPYIHTLRITYGIGKTMNFINRCCRIIQYPRLPTRAKVHPKHTLRKMISSPGQGIVRFDHHQPEEVQS